MLISDVVISLAQVPVVKAECCHNLDYHIDAIVRSSEHKADVVVFPELSLTGYELDLIGALAVTPEPENFKELSQSSIDNVIIVIAGYPLITDSTEKPTIGAVICFPDGSVQFYSKQHLHEGEEPFCSKGLNHYIFSVKGYNISLAICADFTSPLHSHEAKNLGAELYLVSALISESGFRSDAEILARIAAKHQFPVLLSNHISVSGGWNACGKNSVWSSTGDHVFDSGCKDRCIVLCKITGNEIVVTKT